MLCHRRPKTIAKVTMRKEKTGPSNTNIKANSRYLRLALLCVLGFAAAETLKRLGYHIPADQYVTMHLILEVLSIVVSFCVFTTAWFAYRQAGNARDTVIGVTFLTAGIFDLIHTFSFRGMPDFLGANTVGKAAAYWTLSRIIVGLGLLMAVIINPASKSKWYSPKYLILLAGVLLITCVLLITLNTHASSELFYDSANGRLTNLKIALEYFVMVLYAAVFFMLSEKRGWGPRTTYFLRSAMITAIFGELAFTLYYSPYDWVNALGHIFKASAYYLILNALFVSSLQKPYEQLSQAKDELQAMYQDAQEHRQEIERSFARIGSALSSSLMLSEALDQIADLAADMLHAECSIVASLDSNRQTVRVTAQRGCEGCPGPIDIVHSISKQVIESKSAVLLSNLDNIKTFSCGYKGHDACLKSMVCAPMIYGEGILGVVAIYSREYSAFGEGDVKLLEAFAAHAAVAMHNAISYERESNIANVLQRSILSASSITTERFELARVYEPAMNEALVGGDFYDIIELSEGKLGLAIGDVSGKGLQAAVHTAMIKFSLRAYVSEHQSPAAALKLLNKAVTEAVGTDAFVTMFYGVLDTVTGSFTYANAGHEPPLHVSNGTYIELPPTGPVLGLDAAADFEEASLTLTRGDILFIYTDGISEARVGGLMMGIEGIAQKLLTCNTMGCEDVAKSIHQAALEFGGGVLKDDVAILAVRAK